MGVLSNSTLYFSKYFLSYLFLAKQGMLKAEAQLLSGLTETERDIFYTLLKKVRSSLR